jgi:hypothetical protein
MNLTPPLDPAVLERVFGLYRLPRILFAAAQLGIADHLAAGPQSVAALAAATGTHAPTLGSLLEVLHNYGVFARQPDGCYALTPFSQRLVTGAAGGANVPFLLGWAGLPAIYEAYGDIGHTLRTGENAFRARHGADFYDFLAAHPEDAALYERAMESTADGFTASARAYDFSRFQTLVDVGGGQGAYASTILKLYPALTAISYDLPQVVARVQPGTAGNRLKLVGGNMFESVPAGADAYLTCTVLRCFNDDDCLRLLHSIRRAMTPHSLLLATEMLVPEARNNVLMSMADMTARLLYGGRDRTESEFAALFAAAGLRHTRTIPTHGTMALLEVVPVT